MNNYKINISLFLLFVLPSLILFTGCVEPVNLQSIWRDREIVVDGLDNEWQNCRLYYDEKTETSIGVYNDDDYIYMCFATKDQAIQRQIFTQGFNMLFNQTGSKDKTWGIRYPSGLIEGKYISLADLKILSSEKDPGKAMKANELANLGIYARFSVGEDERFIYEIKIPLNKTDKTPYAAVPSQVKSIDMGFMTVKAARVGTRGISGFGGSTSGFSDATEWQPPQNYGGG